MSITRHHAEWLTLVPNSGPFLSMPVLLRVFPQGLEAHDPDVFRSLRMAYEEWDDNVTGRKPDPAIHTAWVDFVLRNVLQFPDEVIAAGGSIPTEIAYKVGQHHEVLRPDIAIREPDPPHKPRLLIQVYPPQQDLEKPVAGKTWKASPASRMAELLRGVDVRLGLVTNGEHWMLVHAPRNETTGFASWYAHLWLEEKITAVARAYGWDDLNLGHGFHETTQGIRFTISEVARCEVLARLLKLNHERYAEEVAQGLHEKNSGSGTGKRPSGRNSVTTAADTAQMTMVLTTAEPSAATSQPTQQDEPRNEQAGSAQNIDDIDYDELIQAIRTVAAANGQLVRDDFIVAVARELGFARTGDKIREAIDNAIRAASRRGIVETGVFGVMPGKVKSGDWTRDDLVDVLCSVLRKGCNYSRDEAIKLAASHIGFKRVGKNIDEAFRSAINGAIRRGLLGYEGDTIWRQS